MKPFFFGFFTSLLYLRAPLSHTRSSYLVCAATQHKVKIVASNKRGCALVHSVKQKGLSHFLSVIFPHSPVHSALCVSWRSCRYSAYCSWEAWVMKNKQPSWCGSSKFVHFLGFFFTSSAPSAVFTLCDNGVVMSNNGSTVMMMMMMMISKTNEQTHCVACVI